MHASGVLACAWFPFAGAHRNLPNAPNKHRVRTSRPFGIRHQRPTNKQCRRSTRAQHAIGIIVVAGLDCMGIALG
eukprot:10793370-Alexandrium_andersonii.AAC.1